MARITAATEATATRLPSPADPAWRQALPRHAGQAMRRDLRLRLGEDADKAASAAASPGLRPRRRAAVGGHLAPPGRRAVTRPRVRQPGPDLAAHGRRLLRGRRPRRRPLGLPAVSPGTRRAPAGGRDQRADQQTITNALVSLVPLREGGARDWPAAHPYTRAHLATHAAQAGRIDDLLTDPAYLLAAGRPQLLAAAGTARSAPARAAADAYRRAAHHLRTAPAEQHASYLQLAARCGRAPQLADALDSCRPHGTWSARWASWRLTTPHRALTGHTDVSDRGGGRRSWTAARWSSPAAATRRCGSWDLATGAPVGDPFTGHDGEVTAVAAAELDGRPVAISGSGDQTVRVWDLATGAPVGDPFTGHTGWVTAVAAAELDGRPVVISGSGDRTVRVWDLATGAPVGDPFTGHTGGYARWRPPSWTAARSSSPAARRDGAGVGPGHRRPGRRPVHRPHRLGTVGGGRRAGRPPGGHLRQRRPRRCGCGTWPPAPRSATRSPATPAGYAVAAAELDGRPVVISGSRDRTVRVWNLARQRAMRHHLRRVKLRHAAPVYAAILIQRRDRVNLITGCTDGVSQAWDLSACRVLSTTIPPGQGEVAAIGTLAPNHVLYANGRTISLYEATGATSPILTIELDSEIQAITTHGTSTVVAATELGLVALEIRY